MKSLHTFSLCNCTLTWYGHLSTGLHMPFGVTIAWLSLFYCHILHIPTRRSVTLLDPMSMINFVAHNSSMTPPPTMLPHPSDHYIKENRTITMMRLCHRSRTQKLYLYETLDLTFLSPVTHHKDPLSKYALKAVSIISSHSGNKTEAFPARDPHTDQTGLT